MSAWQKSVLKHGDHCHALLASSGLEALHIQLMHVTYSHISQILLCTSRVLVYRKQPLPYQAFIVDVVVVGSDASEAASSSAMSRRLL